MCEDVWFPDPPTEPGEGGGGGGDGSGAPLDNNYSGDWVDDSDNNTDSQGPKQSVPTSITLNNGHVVTITFGSTESDHKSADQQVSTKLVSALIAALNQASSYVTINEIYIKATTNGNHSPTSNHYRGLAIDISRINGEYISNLGSNSLVTALQNAFENVPNRRENFGPAFKHKLGEAWTVAGHDDHIHFSVNGD